MAKRNGKSNDAVAICKALDAKYGSPRLGNPTDPLDDLIYITMTNKTSPVVANRIYRALKARFSSWDKVLDTPVSEIEGLIKEAGFAKLRTRFLYGFLKQIKTDFGNVQLSNLRKWEEKESFEYLVQLPGVSNKVAKCVMMYTLGFEVLPVDAHVFRIGRRIGWTNKNRADLSHHDLEMAVPPQYRYSFHVNAIAHGRDCCRPQNPNCPDCPILKYCTYGSSLLRA